MKKLILTACFGVLLFGGAFSFEAKAATTLYVTDTGDGTANYEGCYDGCTLREAMRQARDGDTILFARPLFNTPQTITLTSGRPLSLGNRGTVTINGENTVTINGNNSTGIFSVSQDYHPNLWQMKLTNGNAGTQGGGGISVYRSSISLYLVEINNCKGGVGGAISSSLSSVNIDRSTLYNNSATSYGSAIYFYQTGSLNITSSTISGNTSPDSRGAAIYTNESDGINIVNSTITKNSANGGNSAGGICNDRTGPTPASDYSSSLYLTSSIVAENPNVDSPNISGRINSQSYSLLSGDPHLLPLADNVDPDYNQHILTHALDACSPAINAGDPNPTTGTDQRFARRVQQGRSDIGAFESNLSPCPTAVTVTNGNDSGGGSLRQAIADIAPDGTIDFAPNVSNIVLTSGELAINKNLTIGNTASNATALTINGNNQSRIFNVSGGTTLNLNKLNLANGNANGGGGGAISNNGTLNITNSAIVNNKAQDAGGGISNSGTLSLTNSTVSGNQANGKGAGIYNNGGGGIIATIVNSTITNNRGFGYTGAGVWNESGSTFRVRNSIIDGNVSDQGYAHDYVGGLTDQGNNLIGSGNSRLVPLGNYGGAAQTHALLQNSAALDAGNNCVLTANGCGDGNPALTTDQRGAPRKVGSAVDIGAFERISTFDPANPHDGTVNEFYVSEYLFATRQSDGARASTLVIIPIAGQSLPPGLSLTDYGQGLRQITGTPSAAGTYTFTLKGIYANGMADVQQYSIVITPPSAATLSGWVTFGGNPLAGVTITLTKPDNSTTTTTTGANGQYSFNALPSGSYTVTPAKTNFSFTPASRNLSLSGTDATGVNFSATSTATPSGAGGSVLISEFRLRGPLPTSPLPNDATGERDEFIELYNNTSASVDISNYKLDTSAGFTITVPANTVLPARAHYLIVNSDGYSLNSYAAPDLTFSGIDLPPSTGLVLLNTASQIVDAAGTTNSPAPYFEGTALAPVAVAGDYSFVRKLNTGRPQDTGDNQADFDFVSTDGATYDGRQSTLGAPGPESLTSPVERNSQIGLSLLDASAAKSSPPNRVRDSTSDPANNSTFGTLSIRRRVVNNTGAPVTRLRFRIINITGYPVPNGVMADVRARSSLDAVVNNINDPAQCSPNPAPCSVTVRGTTLEVLPNQPNGGGLNSTLSVMAVTTAPATGQASAGGDEIVGTQGLPVTSDTINLAAPLANGESINVQFLLGIQKTGTFRFLLNVEAVTN